MSDFDWKGYADNPVKYGANVITGDGVKITPYTGWELGISMTLHPEWIKQMDTLEVGDLVTTNEGKTGIVAKAGEMTELGIKKYEVLIEGKRETLFSLSLKKMEEE